MNERPPRTTLEALRGEAFEGELISGVAVDEHGLAGKEFERCTFEGCSFQSSRLARCRFDETSFRRCNLSLMTPVDCRFLDVTFEDCKLTGVDWTKAGRPSIVSQVRFERCILDHARFTGLKLRGWALRESSLVEADFADADLSGCDLTGSRMDRARFFGTDLRGADLEGARGYWIDPTLNRVRGAAVSWPDASGMLLPLGVVIENGPAEAPPHPEE